MTPGRPRDAGRAATRRRCRGALPRRAPPPSGRQLLRRHRSPGAAPGGGHAGRRARGRPSQRPTSSFGGRRRSAGGARLWPRQARRVLRPLGHAAARRADGPPRSGAGVALQPHGRPPVRTHRHHAPRGSRLGLRRCRRALGHRRPHAAIQRPSHEHDRGTSSLDPWAQVLERAVLAERGWAWLDRARRHCSHRGVRRRRPRRRHASTGPAAPPRARSPSPARCRSSCAASHPSKPRRPAPSTRSRASRSTEGSRLRAAGVASLHPPDVLPGNREAGSPSGDHPRAIRRGPVASTRGRLPDS